MIKVSVIITTYNRLGKLKKAIASVLNQSFQDFELIIINDGSTDDTYNYLSGIQSDRVTCLSIENSGGPAKPRNVGIEKAKGEYVAFCDDDDYWLPEKLFECVKELNFGADLVYHNCFVEKVFIRFWTPTIIRGRQYDVDVFDGLLGGGNSLINSSVVVRRCLLARVEPIDESVEAKAIEDFDLWLRLAKTTDKFKHIDKVLGVYHLGTDSISKNPTRVIGNLDYIRQKYQLVTLPKWMLLRYLVAYFKISDKANLILTMRFLRNCELNVRESAKLLVIKLLYKLY